MTMTKMYKTKMGFIILSVDVLMEDNRLSLRKLIQNIILSTLPILLYYNDSPHFYLIT